MSPAARWTIAGVATGVVLTIGAIASANRENRERMAESARLARQRMSDTAGDVRDRVTETTQTVKDRVSESAQDVRDRVTETTNDMRERAQEARDRRTENFERRLFDAAERRDASLDTDEDEDDFDEEAPTAVIEVEAVEIVETPDGDVLVVETDVIAVVQPDETPTESFDPGHLRPSDGGDGPEH